MKLHILTKEEKLMQASTGNIIPAKAFVYDESLQEVCIITPKDKALRKNAGDTCYLYAHSDSHCNIDGECIGIEEAKPLGQSIEVNRYQIDMLLDGEITLEQLLDI